MNKDEFLLYSKLPIFKKHVSVAKSRVIDTLSVCQNPYVALSGGKDSTVVLSLAREQSDNIPAIWSDDEWFLPETKEYMDSISNLTIIRTRAWHADFFQVNGDFNGIPDYAKRNGFDLVFLGLRQDESITRKIHLRQKGYLFKCSSDGFWHSNPIHDWNYMDVWAYIFSRNIKYNKAYDKLTDMGIDRQSQRIGPLAVERVLGYGQIAILKRGWPDLFNRFAEKFPEVRSYV